MRDGSIQIIIAIVTSVLASSGFWALIATHCSNSGLSRKLMLGLAHDRIIYLGMYYISRGDWITQDEYENLNDYLYFPYLKLHGNGTAKRVMESVSKLRIVKEPVILPDK